MSRIGKLPVPVPSGVTVTAKDGTFEAKGPKGTETLKYNADFGVELKDDHIHVTRPSDEREHRALHGLTRTLIANAIEGVEKGFEKILEINGVGYKAELKGETIVLSLNFASPVEYVYPKEVQIAVNGNKVHVTGTSKKMVGEVAAKIRAYRKPEPYNGKGVKYLDEVIKRKAGKATA